MFDQSEFTVLVINGCFQTENDFAQDIALAIHLPDMAVFDSQCCAVFKDQQGERFLADICVSKGWIWKEIIPVGQLVRHESAMLIHAPLWLVQQALEEKGCNIKINEEPA